MRGFMLILLGCIALMGCDERPATVGGGWIKGRYGTIVELNPAGTDRLELDIYEDFTCPACQRFELKVLPTLMQRYGNKLTLRRHYLAAPSTQISPMVLYEVGKKQGREAAVASALLNAQLEHKDTPANDDRVRRVAKDLGLSVEFGEGMQDAALAANIRKAWAAAAHKVVWFPQIVIQGELVTNGDQENLIEVLDSVVAGQVYQSVVVERPRPGTQEDVAGEMYSAPTATIQQAAQAGN